MEENRNPQNSRQQLRLKRQRNDESEQRQRRRRRRPAGKASRALQKFYTEQRHNRTTTRSNETSFEFKCDGGRSSSSSTDRQQQQQQEEQQRHSYEFKQGDIPLETPRDGATNSSTALSTALSLKVCAPLKKKKQRSRHDNPDPQGDVPDTARIDLSVEEETSSPHPKKFSSR